MATYGYDDLRSNFVGPLDPSECYRVGVGSFRSRLADGPLRINTAPSSETDVPSYTATPLPARKVRSDRVLQVPIEAPEINDITDPRIPTVECDATEAVFWTYQAREVGNLERIIVRLSNGCQGVKARVYGNNGGDCIELRPDGSVVQARYRNVPFTDFPPAYPTPAPFQNGRDRGASCEVPLTAGSLLVVGVVLLDDNGPVREPSDCPTCVFDRGSALPVRRAQVSILLYRPTVQFATDPVQTSRDEVSGSEFVTIRSLDSRQVSGYRVQVGDAFSDTLLFVTPATAGARWSQAAPSGEVWSDVLPLPLGTLPANGSPVTVTVTPLGANQHWDLASLDDQAITVTTAVTVPAETGPTTAADLDLTVFPNPIRTSGTVQFTLDQPMNVTVTVIDVMGRQVARIQDGELSAGQQSVDLNARGLASGVYWIRVLGKDLYAIARLVVTR